MIKLKAFINYPRSINKEELKKYLENFESNLNKHFYNSLKDNEKIIAKVEVSGRLSAMFRGKEFWCINCFLEPEHHFDNGDETSDKYFIANNYFVTKEKCLKAINFIRN